MNGNQAYILSKKYTQDTAVQFGAVIGAPCKIKSVEKRDNLNIVTFEWKNDEGEIRTSRMEVEDGTPIYTWTSGTHYEYGDLVIYQSCFYRCITPNEDIEFNDRKWNEIGNADGNYDIVERASELPARFTAADRKMYYSIEDAIFYLWNGYEWIGQITPLATPDNDGLLSAADKTKIDELPFSIVDGKLCIDYYEEV